MNLKECTKSGTVAYDPKTYWANRANPNKYDSIQEYERQILYPLVRESETILDYGVGTGRFMLLYTGKTVRGIDIVDNYRDECFARASKFDVSFTWSKDIGGNFDLGVISKVLLHSKNPKKIVNKVYNHCDKVYISTGVNGTAPHCFNHDYKDLLSEYDIKTWQENGNHLTIVI